MGCLEGLLTTHASFQVEPLNMPVRKIHGECDSVGEKVPCVMNESLYFVMSLQLFSSRSEGIRLQMIVGSM